MDPNTPTTKEGRVELGRHVTSSETRRWCRQRSGEPHRRLDIVAVMESPVANGAHIDRAWHLDALLLWALLHIVGRNMPYTEGDPLDLPLPLARRDGMWATSCLAPWGDTQSGWVWFRKRPEAHAAETWLRPNRLPIKAGPHRAQQKPLRVHTTTLISARAVGSPTAVAELLAVITSVGKNRGHGYGAVREWGITTIPGDPDPEWAWRAEDGRALRPIPTNVAHRIGATGRTSIGTTTPPYWWTKDGRAVEVITP